MRFSILLAAGAAAVRMRMEDVTIEQKAAATIQRQVSKKLLGGDHGKTPFGLPEGEPLAAKEALEELEEAKEELKEQAAKQYSEDLEKAEERVEELMTEQEELQASM